MSKETPKIQSKLTDLEKVGWTRLGHRLSLVSFGSLCRAGLPHRPTRPWPRAPHFWGPCAYWQYMAI